MNDDQVRVYQNGNFYEGGRVLVLGYGNIVKMQYLFYSTPSHSGMNETNQVYCNDDQGRVIQTF